VYLGLLSSFANWVLDVADDIFTPFALGDENICTV
jgi:hypothetical protein